LPEEDAGGYGEDDPDDEEAVEEGEGAKRGVFGGEGTVVWEMLEIVFGGSFCERETYLHSYGFRGREEFLCRSFLWVR